MKPILAILLCGLQLQAATLIPPPNLTAEYNKGKNLVLLKWQNTDSQATGFILQRSNDNNNWKDIYELESSKFSKKKLEKFSDRQPGPADNFYRLKIISSNKTEYSESIMVIIGRPLSSWTMFPVPVTTVLNLRYNGSEAIQGVVSVFIQSMNGRILARRRYSSLSRTIQIPVDNLGRGIYDVRIIINDEVVWNQRFVK